MDAHTGSCREQQGPAHLPPPALEGPGNAVQHCNQGTVTDAARRQDVLPPRPHLRPWQLLPSGCFRDAVISYRTPRVILCNVPPSGTGPARHCPGCHIPSLPPAAEFAEADRSPTGWFLGRGRHS